MAYNWQNGITKTQETTLEHIEYIEEVGRVVTDVPLQTTLNSFYIGGQHAISSGGDNVFLENQSTGIAYQGTRAGIRRQSDAVNQDSGGIIRASTRRYNDNLILIETVGPEHESAVRTDIGIFTFPFNMSVHGIELIAGEDIAATDVISWNIYNESRSEGIQLYQQLLTGRAYAEGDRITWWFDHPIEMDAGSVVDRETVVTNIDGEEHQLLARAAAGDTDAVYTVLKFRTYTDELLAEDVETKTRIGESEFTMQALIASYHPEIPERLTIHRRDGNMIQTRDGEDVIWDLSD